MELANSVRASLEIKATGLISSFKDRGEEINGFNDSQGNDERNPDSRFTHGHNMVYKMDPNSIEEEDGTHELHE